MGIIYVATHKTNGRKYVGQTVQTLQKRNWCRRGNTPFNNAFKKYGEAGFDWDITENVPEDEMDNLEVSLIKSLNTIFPNGYNLDSGGNANKHRHESTIQKIRIANMGRVVSKESRQRMSISATGARNFNFGKKRSDEFKKDRSIGMTGENNHRFGNSPSEQTKVKLSDTQKGKHVGELNQMYGKFGKDHPNSKAVLQLDMITGKVIAEYAGLCEAERAVAKGNHSLISMCCTGKRKSHAGFRWKYKIEEIKIA